MKNLKVVLYSLLGLICIVLSFAVNWLFIIPAVILSGISWRILMGEKK